MKVWLCVGLTIIISACSMQELESKDVKKTTTTNSQIKQYNIQTIHIQCPRCDDVQLFDGFTLLNTTSEHHTWAFQVSGNQQNLIVFATTKGKSPTVQNIKNMKQPIHINLSVETLDKRLSTLTGIIADTSTSPNAYGISKLYPQTELIISRGRARQAITTDQHGLFSLALSPGRYQIMIEGRLHTVDVPNQDAIFLPIILHHTIIN